MQAAIDAVKKSSKALAVDGESPSEEDEAQRYPGLNLQAPSQCGPEIRGPSTNAAVGKEAGAAKQPVMVRDLPPAPKSVLHAMERYDWPLWESALKAERQSMIDHGVCENEKAPPDARRLRILILLEYKGNQAGELELPKCLLVGQGSSGPPCPRR